MKKTTGIWSIIMLIAIYAISIIITIFAQLTGRLLFDFVSLIINVLLLALLLVCVYKLYFLEGNVLAWLNAVFGFIIISKLLTFVTVLLPYSPIIGPKTIFYSFLESFILILAIWIGSFRYLKKILTNPQFVQEQLSDTNKPDKTRLIVGIVILLVLGVLPTTFYLYWFLPSVNNNLIRVAIIDTLADALNYSLSKNNSINKEIINIDNERWDSQTGFNFLGFHPTLPKFTPKCSGPLVINISPDGGRIVVFGKSCTGSVYYCSALPSDTSSIVGNFNQPISTVPASVVSANKFDCDGSIH